jgi:hypothetical protein
MKSKTEFCKAAWNALNLTFVGMLTLMLAHGADTTEPKQGVTEPRLEKKVKYATAQASVQDIVQELARQVGLGYEWQKSFAQTDPLCRKWVRNVAIEGKPCQDALEELLKPLGLRYQVENEAIVLYRR